MKHQTGKWSRSHSPEKEGSLKLFEKIEQKGAGAMLKRNRPYLQRYLWGEALIFMLYMNFLVIVGLLFFTPRSLFLGKLWDAITDPIVGNLSTRRGRMRKAQFTIDHPVLASFIRCTPSASAEKQPGSFITCWRMFFGTAFTIVMVPYNAILPEMTSDYNERTSFLR